MSLYLFETCFIFGLNQYQLVLGDRLDFPCRCSYRTFVTKLRTFPIMESKCKKRQIKSNIKLYQVKYTQITTNMTKI